MAYLMRNGCLVEESLARKYDESKAREYEMMCKVHRALEFFEPGSIDRLRDDAGFAFDVVSAAGEEYTIMVCKKGSHYP